MKMKSMLGMFLLLISGVALGQDRATNIEGKIEPCRIDVGYDKTINLIFPYSIKSVDKGSGEVLMQKAQGVENILQLKAGIHNFTQTNLTVVTGEGALYSFLLHYAYEPKYLNLKVSEMMVPIEQIAILSDKSNEAEIQQTAKRIATKQRINLKPRDKRFEMGISVQGIYVHGDVMYLQLVLENDSYINYDVDQFRMYFKDRKKSKRTATQEVEVKPIYLEGNANRIEGKSRQIIVIALEKFTIPDKKNLIIQIMEKNGGRNLEIKLNNKHVVKANAI